MSISKSQNIIVDLVGDGIATSVDVNLERDPYFLVTQSLGASTLGLAVGATEQIDQLPVSRTNPPISVANVGATIVGNHSYSASLAYPILTLTFGAALSATPDSVQVRLLW